MFVSGKKRKDSSLNPYCLIPDYLDLAAIWEYYDLTDYSAE
jgi:hypothetical protein